VIFLSVPHDAIALRAHSVNVFIPGISSKEKGFYVDFLCTSLCENLESFQIEEVGDILRVIMVNN
jgi:hypothetical protein